MQSNESVLPKPKQAQGPVRPLSINEPMKRPAATAPMTPMTAKPAPAESFAELKLMSQIQSAVKAEGYEKPTPIQREAIPVILSKRDLLGVAQTGTGKTAAFALPILQLFGQTPDRNDGRVRALILTPTRELASQIAESFTKYGRGLRVRNTVIFGGVGQKPQEIALRRGVEVVIATPGRLLDLLQQRLIDLRDLEIFVLDEADRMLDMGFIHDVRRVITAIPKRRQTLFFSATMPPEIAKLAGQILTQPTKVEVTPVASTAEKIAQSLFFVAENQKTSLLIQQLADPGVKRALVFTRTKRDANRVAEALSHAKIGAAAIHGNKSQNARERALDSVKEGKTRVLVATDIASRGIDIDEVTHVFNYDIPNIPESYVHRIGRTARAGLSGVAVSFCSPAERGFLADIEKLIRRRLHVGLTPSGLEVEFRKRRGGRRPPGQGGGQRPGGHGGHGQGGNRQHKGRRR